MNGTHTSKKKRSKDKPHIYSIGKVWGGSVANKSSGCDVLASVIFCQMMNKARNTIEGK
tara:strand:- start:1319 stop:1495 length:177 start_codon:yes stop_codon:yes gene_type:complete